MGISLKDRRIAIWGLGLMGGSLAMALREHCQAIYAIDRDPGTLELAQRHRLVDRLSDRAEDILPLSDLVVLALPVRTILQAIKDLSALHPGEAVVIDLGSTKEKIVAAMQELPARFDPIGGHPMCGKEVGTLINAEPGLFNSATFAFSPLERSSPSSKDLAMQLSAAVGAHALFIEASIHDAWVSASSHLPYLLANCLAAVTPLEVTPLIGPGFRSTARLAPSSMDMMLDILATNKRNILDGLQVYLKRLVDLQSLMEEEDDGKIGDFLRTGAEKYQDLVSSGKGRK